MSNTQAQMNPDLSSVFVRVANTADTELVDKHRRDSAQESTKYRGSIETPQDVRDQQTYEAGYNETVLASLTIGQKSDGVWHISHVFVEPEAREVGIGDALVRHVIDALAKLGARWIGAQALPGDRAMKNLFERHGLVAQTITVGRAINAPSTEGDVSQ